MSKGVSEQPLDCSVYDRDPMYQDWPAYLRKHSRTECELKEELRSYLATHQGCSNSAECTVVETSCPFGCGVAVSVRYANDVVTKYGELLQRYRAMKVDCKYRCAPVGHAVCARGRCAAVR